MISSPCIDVCEIGNHGRCIGCFRTTAQIEQWISFSEEQRLQIMEENEIAQWELNGK